MTETTILKGAANPAIYLETIMLLAAHHLAAAADRRPEYDGQAAGIQAEHVVNIDGLISAIEDAIEEPAGDLVLAREWVARTGSVFAAGVDFGLSIAVALASDPLGKPRASAVWNDAVDAVKDELQSLVDAATTDAANVHEAAARGKRTP